ncbi:unnamed protein product [Parajaminaea phylloscopi]
MLSTSKTHPSRTLAYIEEATARLRITVSTDHRSTPAATQGQADPLRPSSSHLSSRTPGLILPSDGLGCGVAREEIYLLTISAAASMQRSKRREGRPGRAEINLYGTVL